MAIRINGDNTTAAPGVTRGDDTDTGIQFGTDEVSIVTGGSNRLVIGNSGITQDLNFDGANAVFSNGNGVNFSNNTGSPVGTVNAVVAQNTLTDYEEGSFDIVMTGGTSGTFSLNSSSTKLKYIKIGRKVAIFGRFNAARGTAAGPARVALPFAPDTTSFGGGAPDFNGLSVFTHDVQDTGATNTIGTFGEISGANHVTLFWLRTGQAWHAIDATDFSTSLGVCWIYIAGSYYSAV
jgi:hypothetical protein